jgi:LysM repeat protein
MAAIDPGVVRGDAFARTLRIVTRLVAFLAYAVCVAALFLAVKPLLPARGADPVVLPTEAKPTVYRTRPGDTLESIAATHGLSLQGLLVLNPGKTSIGLRPGTKLRIG